MRLGLHFLLFYLGMIYNTVLVSGVQHSDLIALKNRLYFIMYCYKILGVIPHGIELIFATYLLLYSSLYLLIPYLSFPSCPLYSYFFLISVGTTAAMLGNTLNNSCDYLPYII